MEEKINKLKFIGIILLVVLIGLVCINLLMSYKFKAQFLLGPCELCQDLNPNQSKCVGECFIEHAELFPDRFGNWNNQIGYDGVIPQIEME